MNTGLKTLTLEQAAAIVDGVLDEGRSRNLEPLTVAVLDDGGHLLVFKREDGAGGAMRPQMAIAKAYCAIGLGRSSRAVGDMAMERPHFVDALVGVSNGRVLPVPGGLPIRGDRMQLLGAVGVTGDTSDNDELAAMSGISSAGLRSDTA